MKAAAAALAGLAVLVFLRPFWCRALGLVAIFGGVLLDYAGDMNRLADDPRWYNAATTN